MPIVYHRDVPVESFPGGATYQTLVGYAQGSVPVRIGLQMSLPTHLRPGFRVTGDQPVTPYGVPVSPERIVHIHEE
jgi:hypothetical protein